MVRSKTTPSSRRLSRHDEAEQPTGRTTDTPLPDAFTQIREAKDAIVAAIIDRAIKDGCHQRAKWLFEFGAIVPSGHRSPEDEPSLVRLLLDQLQIPESEEELAAELSANDHVVE